MRDSIVTPPCLELAEQRHEAEDGKKLKQGSIALSIAMKPNGCTA